MRQVFMAMFAGLAVTVLSAAQALAGTVEVKGPHICCMQCVNVVGTILGKVDGVTDVKADVTTKTVTFTAKDDAAAKAGVKALIDGGFFGSAKSDGKELKVDVTTPEKGAKADVVTVKDVHVCCGACQKAVNSLFKDAKVSYTGKGPQKNVRIEGTAATTGEIIEALRKTGFNGTLEK